MKKKGIILLITLFFISAISVLILKNLGDSEKFISEVSFDTKLTQFKIVNENVQQEIIKILNENKDYIDDILKEAQIIPLRYGNVNLLIELVELPTKECNINNIKNVQDIVTQCNQDVSYNIENQYKFVEDLNKIRKDTNITNQQQLDYFIEEYKTGANDDQIDNISDKFSYISTDENATYLSCKYTILLDELSKANSYFIFKLDTDTPLANYFTLE